MIGITASTTDLLTAIGTVGAVVVALGLSIVPGLRRWRARPVLRFEFGKVEPYTRIDLSPTAGVITGGGFNGTTLVRAGVRNIGRTEARRVRVQIHAWWVLENGLWWQYDLDPVLLRWVSQPSENEIDIAPALQDLVEVVGRSTDGRHRLSIRLTPPPPFDFQATKSYSPHRVELVAFGEGAESIRAVMEYQFTESGGVEVTRAEPPDGEIQPLGLLGIFLADPGLDDSDSEGDLSG